MYSKTLQKWDTEKKISGSCSGSSKKPTNLTRFFSVAAADAEDIVIQLLLDHDNHISNLVCVAKSASESENTLPEAVDQN